MAIMVLRTVAGSACHLKDKHGNTEVGCPAPIPKTATVDGMFSIGL